MRRIREVLRLRDEHGASQRQIVAACRLPRTTVRDYLRRLKAAGLTYAAVAAWSDDALEAQLFPRTPAPAGRSEPDWAYVARELGRRGVTLKLLWREHLEAVPDGYRYTQFVARFREWQGAHKEPRLLRAHTPGEMVEIDYAGMTLSVGVGAAARPAQVFVAVLPYSGYLFADVTWSQQSADWLASHVRLFEHLGGVPSRLVPDNLKVGVTHASFYDPAINAGYHELARHYDTAVVPTRARKPRDKPSVENGVLQAERRVLAVLRDRVFATLAEARAAVVELVAQVNDDPLTSQPGMTRRELFTTIERPTLKALPAAAFVIGSWARFKVPETYHVTVDGVAYSLPHRLIAATVDIHAGPEVIQIFHRNKRVACHRRQAASGDPRSGRDRVTLDAHKPSNHKAVESYTPARVAEELAAIGPAAAAIYARIRVDADHDMQAARQGRGLIRLAALHGAARLEATCEAALAANIGAYRYIERTIEQTDVSAPATAGVGDHANLRGPSYYH